MNSFSLINYYKPHFISPLLVTPIIFYRIIWKNKQENKKSDNKLSRAKIITSLSTRSVQAPKSFRILKHLALHKSKESQIQLLQVVYLRPENSTAQSNLLHRRKCFSSEHMAKCQLTKIRMMTHYLLEMYCELEKMALKMTTNQKVLTIDMVLMPDHLS